MASRFTQSFAFHQSPEAFISSRIQQFAQQLQPESKPIVRAEILNRNVHLITSYQLCESILLASEPADAETQKQLSRIIVDDPNGRETAANHVPPGTFAVGPAYDQLMVAFFPHPNVLLKDGTEHLKYKSTWQSAFPAVVEASIPIVRDVVAHTFTQLQNGESLDLYETLKTLSWDILFAIFLGLKRDEDRKGFDAMETLQESVLRGQFSLFPVPIRTPFWTSARSRGIKAVQDLGPSIKDQLRAQRDHSKGNAMECPFAKHIIPNQPGEESLSEEEIVSHTRLFTSSIANKALGSLLTAFLMNLFLWRDPNHQKSLATLITEHQDVDTQRAMLDSILTETLRLSPPVIGVMRRITQTVHINESRFPSQASHTIPAGHDAWLYFSAANRDPDIFDSPNEFHWDRFMGTQENSNHDWGFAFGLGAKSCLGGDLMRQICLAVAETMMQSSISIGGSEVEEGVKAWLGWKPDVGIEAFARDLKQLPCQRPRNPVIVTLSKPG